MSIPLILGIVSSYYLKTDFLWLHLIPISICLLVLLWLINKRYIVPNFLFNLTLYGCLFILGYANHQLRSPQFQKHHYSHTTLKGSHFIDLTITEILKPSQYHQKYIGEIHTINDEAVTGNILVSITQDSLHHPLSIDKNLLIYTALKPLNAPKNPYQFNYKKHLETKGIYSQIFINNSEILQQQLGKSTIKGFAEKVRISLAKKLDATNIQEENLGIIKALILGDRRQIDPQLNQAYASAGAIHILAVSGLHVGILFLIFNQILKPLTYLPKGKLTKLLVLLLLLWGFAGITGLSASVVRATTMFSFFIVAKGLQRITNPINTLFISLFFILLIAPEWLFHVGFQLSYLAVFFIIWLLPKFQKSYHAKHWLFRKLYDLISVSICAQLGVAPLSIYYFHQFPGLFLVTNIVVLPFLGFVIAYGLFIILLSALDLPMKFLAQGLDFVLSNLNAFIHWIAAQDFFLVENIALSKEEMFSIYVLIFSLSMGWISKKRHSLLWALTSLCLYFGIKVYQQEKAHEMLAVLHKTSQSIFVYSNASEMQVYHSNAKSILQEYPLKNWVASKGATPSEASLPNIFEFGTETFIVIDSLGVYPKTKSCYVVLTQHSKVNLNRLIDSLAPKQIIADGSNYRSYVSFWSATCKQRNIPFYSTLENGAFILKNSP